MVQSITCTGFSIFPQLLASWTLAVVAADGVAAAVLAAAVPRGALVDICQEKAQAASEGWALTTAPENLRMVVSD